MNKNWTPEDIRQYGMNDELNQLFKDGVTITIIDHGKSACLTIGTTKYYFNPVIKTEDYNGVDNKIHNRIVLKYDGWEKKLTGTER